jgi:hypothetical protein
MFMSRWKRDGHVTIILAGLFTCPGAAHAATAQELEPPATSAPAPTAGKAEDKKTDCAIGVAVWCFARSARDYVSALTTHRVEAFGGYKLTNTYYDAEIRGCNASGCTLRFTGPAFGLDAYVNLKGDPRSDDYLALGIATAFIPIVSEIRNNTSGFRGEFGRIRAGEGAFGYVPIRLSLRRPNFLYLIESKYLISSFGIGLAIPVHSGAGDTFTGADSPKLTIGGKLGAEMPLTGALKIGIATNWSVIWYGSTFGEASFASAYGLNLSYLM